VRGGTEAAKVGVTNPGMKKKCLSYCIYGICLIADKCLTKRMEKGCGSDWILVGSGLESRKGSKLVDMKPSYWGNFLLKSVQFVVDDIKN
jgi:hypothetical protein